MLRLLLLLYPPAFRRTLGREALADLRREIDDARTRGGPAGWAAAVGALVAFAYHGLAERAMSVRRGGEGLFVGWSQDIRLAIRSSMRRPTFAVVSVVSLAVGIGANSVLFSVADTLFLRAIPGVTEPDRIVELGTNQGGSRQDSWSYPDFVSVRSEAPLEAAAFYELDPVSVATGDGGRQVLALHTTADYFEVVGVTLPLGRAFRDDEDDVAGAHTVTVLSHKTWVEDFDADPGVLGAQVTLNRRAYTVIGVAPESFRGHHIGAYPAYYVTITQHRSVLADEARFLGSRNTSWGQAIARIPAGQDIEGVNASLETLFHRLENEYPESNIERRAWAAPAGLAPSQARGLLAITASLIFALALLVLGATCANVAGMLLARAAARERELAVRAALGSGRGTLIRHVMTEAVIIFGVGGAVGVYGARQLLRVDPTRFLPTPVPIEIDFALDLRMILFGLALTIGTGALFGLLPALQVTRSHVAHTLRDAAGGSGVRASRLRRVFVGGQVAVSVLLLGSAGLLTKSVLRMNDLDPGFETDGVYVWSFDLANEGWADPMEATVFAERLGDAIRELPDVEGATLGSDIPLDGGSSSTPVWLGVRSEETPWVQANYAMIGDHYFSTLGVSVTQGRGFSLDDGPNTDRVAIVNQAFVDRAWPDARPIGRTIEFGLESEQYTVVGVVADTKADMITDRQSPQVFAHLRQSPVTDLHLAVRLPATPGEGVAAVRRTIEAVDPALAVSLPRSLSEMAALGMLPTRILAGLAGSLGALALLLSALGLYGVVSFAVTQRTREIGVRVALGAGRARVVGRVVGGGFLLALPGVVVGLLLSLGMGQVMRGILPMNPLDLGTYGLVFLVLGFVIGGACLMPAVRAAAVQPMEALRFD